MLYKGRGKHEIEDLEDMIEELREELFDANLRTKEKNVVLQELIELTRDIHKSCVDLEQKPDEIECLKVVQNIKMYLERFAQDNKIDL